MEDLENELAAMQLELQRMSDQAGQPAVSCDSMWTQAASLQWIWWRVSGRLAGGGEGLHRCAGPDRSCCSKFCHQLPGGSSPDGDAMPAWRGSKWRSPNLLGPGGVLGEKFHFTATACVLRTTTTNFRDDIWLFTWPGRAGGPPAEDITRNCGRPWQDVARATHWKCAWRLSTMGTLT